MSINAEEIISRNPVDFTAVRVTQFKGEEYIEPKLSKNNNILEEIKAVPRPIYAEDFSKRGNLSYTVEAYIGCVYRNKPGKGVAKHLWACRCRCGRFFRTNNKTLRDNLKTRSANLKCAVCNWHQKIRYQATIKQQTIKG